MNFSDSLRKNRDFQIIYNKGKSFANKYWRWKHLKMTLQPKEIQVYDSWIQSKNEYGWRKKGFSSQKSKGKKSIVSVGRRNVAFSSI